MISSVTKGKIGELEFCREFSKLIGHELLIRNLEQCRSGGHDLKIRPGPYSKEQKKIVVELDKFSIEIKRYKKYRESDIEKWWQQACHQAERIKKKPMLAYRGDREKWKCVIHLNNVKNTDCEGCVTLSLKLFSELLKKGCSDATPNE